MIDSGTPHQKAVQTDRRIGQFAGNAAALALVPLVARLSGFVFVVLVAQRYGERDLGIYRFSLVLVWYFLEFARLGLSPLLIREMAAHPREASRVYFTGLSVRLATVGLSWVMLSLIVVGFDYDTVTRWTIGLFALALLFMIASDTNNQAFVAVRQAGYTFVTETIGAVGFLSLSLVALHFDLSIVGLAAAKLLSTFLQAAVGWGLVARHLSPFQFAVRRGTALKFLGEGWPFTVIALTAYLISEVDVFLLRQMTSLEILGLYAAAQTFGSALKSALAGLGLATAPVLSNLFADGNLVEMRAFGQAGLRLTAWFSLFCIALLTVLAEPLMHYLFGEAFLQVAPTLRILVWALPFYGISNIVGFAILAAGGERSLMVINGLVTTVNVALNLLLIPLSPLLAVAGVAVVSYLFCAVLYVRLAGRLGVCPAGVVSLHARPLMAAIGACLVLWAIRYLTSGAIAEMEKLWIQAQRPAIVFNGTTLALSAFVGLLCYLLLLRLVGELDTQLLALLRGADPTMRRDSWSGGR